MRRAYRTTVWMIAGACLLSVAANASQLTAQAAPEPVDFRPFADGRNWIVKQNLTYRVGISKDSVVVPLGFVTDLASIPPALQSLIQQNGPYLLPAVVHDYLYWKQTCTRTQSDHLLRLAMIENQVGKVVRDAIYNAVRAAGSFAWSGNTRERTNHVLKILPEDRLNIRALVLWPDYRRQLMSQGVTDGPDYVISPRFCARGDMSIKAALETP
jgi:hypothetical protein